MSDDDEIEKYARDAINQYLARVTYPVLWTDEQRMIPLGTGVLFRWKDRHFLLTAAHLFDKFEGEYFPFSGLVGPTSRAIATPPGLGKLEAHVPYGEEGKLLDTFALELLDADFIKAISDTWSFITIEDFAAPEPSVVYFVSGFPKERERREGELVGAALLALTTRQREDVPNTVEGYDPRFDFLLKYDKIATDFYNYDKLVEAPAVHGVSGGPVFRVADEAPAMWTPRTGTRFVGLQSSTSREKHWLRVKSTVAIATYFSRAVPEIGAAIAAQLKLS